MLVKQVETYRRKNVPRGVWDYIDWELRCYNMQELEWSVEVLGKAIDLTTFRKRMNGAVKATDQILRNDG